MFAPSVLDSEAVWLIGIYVQEVWVHIICKKKYVSQRQIKTECAQQYINHQAFFRPSYFIFLFSVLSLFQNQRGRK